MTCNLEDAESTRALLRDSSPAFIFHLAGRTGVSFNEAIDSHVRATVGLLDMVRQLGLDAIIVIPGSSAQYGDVAEERQPIAEETEYKPVTLYGIAKATEAWAAAHFHRTFGMNIIRTHTFNCVGPGQRAQFVPATFARQIAAMERGETEPVLHVGNLDARRDMTDIRDVAEAYFHAATLGSPGAVYNVCSGQVVAIDTLVGILRQLSRVEFDVRQDPARLQANDVPAQRGDGTRFARDTGWRPRIGLEQTLTDVLEEWRGVV
jgi:GDP-4-dehydro-6-deoxy-D-mannose reductase